jgi:trimethylamine--corrinoid protein Co-methyltransferase
MDMSDDPAPEPKGAPNRNGRAVGRAAPGEGQPIGQMPWRIPENHDRPTEPVDDEGIGAIHRGAMRILSEIGIRFPKDEALSLLRRAGCKITGQTVFMDEAFVTEMVARAPAAFTLTPRNPDRRLPVGGRHLLFGSVSSPPGYWDIRRGKVPGFMDGFRDLVKLTQYFNCIHFAGGYPVEPVDVHPSVRHLDCLYEKLVLTDKVVHTYSLGRERVEDAMEMVRIAGGLSHDEFRAQPRMFTNINSASPLKHDHPMIDGALRLARAGQAVIVTPFTLAGAMAPVTMAGAVTLAIAEALSAIALIQYAAPGAPCMIGTFTSNVDMKSGAPAYGTPEYMRATQIAGQMARFYRLPFRSSGVCSANVPDGQSMWETSNSLWAAVQSGSNMVFHAAGWLEGGQTASPEKFVMDCEMLQMIQRYMEPETWATGPEDLAIDTIAEVGADGHYLGCRHTQDRFASAFHTPFASDGRNYETWLADGGLWTAERAHKIASAILADCVPPALDPGINDELRAFVSRRKAEGGAPTEA